MGKNPRGPKRDDEEWERIFEQAHARSRTFYVLDSDNRVVKTDLMGWARWYEDGNRLVDYTQINSEMMVSTVFLGVDHRFFGDGPPLVFETMVFGGPPDLDQSQWRYSSWDDAETGHKAAVRKARAAAKQHQR